MTFAYRHEGSEGMSHRLSGDGKCKALSESMPGKRKRDFHLQSPLHEIPKITGSHRRILIKEIIR